MPETFIPSRDVQLICDVQQFYYREARLLDERCYTQWLALLDEQIDYCMPGRHVPQPDASLRGQEAFAATDRELERYSAQESPIRVENLFHLNLRAERAYKINAWAESPPPRTRRMIHNVEVAAHPKGGLQVYSNFQLYYSHRQANATLYTGSRRDWLIPHGNGWRLRAREVILDCEVLNAPTAGLLF